MTINNYEVVFISYMDWLYSQGVEFDGYVSCI